MANFTKKAIKASFIKLLNERPMNKISVKDIVEDCGINRNSFYYHFQDIPALLEEIVTENTVEIIKKYPEIDSIDAAFHAAFYFAEENRRAAYHIYNSVNRDAFERELMKICQSVVSTYVDNVFGKTSVSEKDREIVLRFIKCEFFGLIIDWLNCGMKDEALDDLLRITELCRGMSEELIKRSTK